MARLFAASLTTSPPLLLPWGLKHFFANLPYSSNKHGLGPTTCCYIKLFHSQTTLYMSRWFVTSLPTLPLCVVLPLGLYTSPPTFPIPQTSSDVVPQPPSCLYGIFFYILYYPAPSCSRASTVLLFILWTNSYNATIKMKALWKNFCILLYIS